MKTKTLSSVVLILAILSISGSDLFAVIRSRYPQRPTPPDPVQTAWASEEAVSSKNRLLNRKFRYCLTTRDRVPLINPNRLAIPARGVAAGHPLND